MTPFITIDMLVQEQIRQVVQAHSEGSSLRGVARITELAYNTVVSIVRSASAKAQLIHNQEVTQLQTNEVIGDEMWSFVKKTEAVCSRRIMLGDCWIALSLDGESGLILAARVGKHTDECLWS